MAWGLGMLAIWVGFSRWAAIDGTPAPGPDERRAAIARVRALLDGKPVAPEPLATAWRGYASLWCGGRLLARPALRSIAGQGAAPEGGGARLLDAAEEERLRALAPDARRACRVKIDVVLGEGPVWSSSEALFAISLIPGVDGIGLALRDGGSERRVELLPDELLAGDLVGGHRPLPGVDFEMGLDAPAVLRLLAARAGLDGSSWRRTPHRLYRVRTFGFIEPADPAARGEPIDTFRGHVQTREPARPLRREELRAAAIASGDYLLRHERTLPDGTGRFEYEYYTLSDQRSPDDGEYALPRHAGATSFLAQLYGATRDERYRDGAARALRYLARHRPVGCDRPELACVGADDAARVDIGSAALALVATAEYLKATGSDEFRPWARRLAAFILSMQRDDGEFCHLYDSDSGRRDERTKLLYYSGEAVLALAKLARVEPDPRYAPAIDRALAYLTDEDYRPLARKYFFGEDHWTCIATAEAWDVLPAPGRPDRRASYGDFCEAFGAFLRRQEFLPGDEALESQPDLLGAYGFGPILPPHPTPVGSRSESMVSTLEVALRRGHSAEAAELKRQLEASFRFLLGRQIGDDNAWLMPNPDAARGGFLQSDLKRNIRIDYLQHSGSALLRGAAFFE